MEKVLRSLVMEKFLSDLRFQLELLSRRRDIINEEKQEELLKMLREAKVEGVVPLGPGTNRYAFNLDGFVVKVATDHDGKIDNFKEFKMAKRLFPYVSKTYEVTTNGTLLVAEYIQPFISYTEMCKYADQIREILTKIGAVYLIGDVGISEKNYTNWGIRPGTTDPVCLDYAYVYEVSSSLFICPECNSHSMLIPNPDFTELYCANKACGKSKTFEQIRAKIGNDIHAHEIGDLTLEGYELFESHVLTTLDTDRSNYLLKKKDENKKMKKKDYQKEIISENNENNDDSLEVINEDEYKEETEMSDFLVNATAVAASVLENDPDLFKDAIPARAMKMEDYKNERRKKRTGESEKPVEETTVEEKQDDESTVAFEVPMQDEEEVSVVEATVVKEETVEETANDDAEETPEEEFDEEAEMLQEQLNICVITKQLIENSHRAVSKMAHRITWELRCESMYDEVKNSIQTKKLFPETFYNNIQNAIFMSLVEHLNMELREFPKKDEEGVNKIYVLPKEINAETTDPNTLGFIQRMYLDEDLAEMEDPIEALAACRTFYDNDDSTFINPLWIDKFRAHINDKMKITSKGLDAIRDAVFSVWCAVTINEETEEELSSDDIVNAVIAEQHANDDAEEDPQEEETIEGSYDTDKEDVGTVEQEEYYQEETPEYGEKVYLNIDIYPEDDTDIIRAEFDDAFGVMILPFYARLQEIDINDEKNKWNNPVDPRNGYWDWVTHFIPDLLFTTNNPEKWLNIVPKIYNESICVIMSSKKVNRKMEYTMGVFFIEGIYMLDDEFMRVMISDEDIPDLLSKLNYVINSTINGTFMSHRDRSLLTGEIYTEKQVLDDIKANEKNNNDNNSNELEDAAVQALIGDAVVEVAEEAIESEASQGSRPAKKTAKKKTTTKTETETKEEKVVEETQTEVKKTVEKKATTPKKPLVPIHRVQK